MKKALMILGGLFLAAIVLVGAFFVYMAAVGPGLDQESKAYVMETVPVLCSTFDLDTFQKHSSPELLKAAPPEELAKILIWFKRLGQFGRVVDVTGASNVSFVLGSGKVVTAKYRAKVEFETGPASIEIVLVKRDDGWRYRLFTINSMALLPGQAPAPPAS